MKITISNPSTPPAPKENKFPAVYERFATGIIYLFFDNIHSVALSDEGSFYQCCDLSSGNFKPRPDISVTFHAENK